MIWVKGYWNYDLGAPMYVYAAPLGAGQSLRIDTTGAATADTTTWNNTAPTAEEFQFNRGNVSGGAPEYYRAWLFATLPGISKVGTYIGNGSEVTVDCGFSTGARFILIKASSGTGDWFVFDSARGIVAGTGLDPALRLNITSAEITNTNYVGTHPSGFQVFNAAVNTSGTTYLFFAMA
jgi:hypothetical protein